MNTQSAVKKDSIPPERLAEAGVWIARLHGDDRDHATETGFRQWLEASPMNSKAFELSTEVWEDSQNLRRVIPFAHEVPQAREKRFRFTIPTLAALTAAAALIAVGIALHIQGAGVSTGIGEQRLLTLEDGTRVFLNTATRVVVSYDKNARKVELKGGEALFDVATRPDWPFIVEAGNRQVRALGTSFVVRYDADQTAVTLVEGKIALEEKAPAKLTDEGLTGAGRKPAKQLQLTTLTPGQRLTLMPGKPAQLDTLSLDNAIAWRRGQVVLDDTPLSSAVAEMNRYNSIKLVIERPEAADLLVNGLFQAGDSTNFANAVAQTYGLQVLDHRDEIVLSGIPRSVAQPDL